MVHYVNRNLDAGFSIGKVFKTIVDEVQKKINVSSSYLPVYGGSIFVIIRNIFYVFKLRNTDKIFHITGDIHYVLLGLIGKKTVLTIHDCVFLENEKNKLKFFIKKLLWLYLPVNIANVVTCISEKTKSEILKYVDCDIKVIHNPVDPIYLNDQSIIKFNSSRPRILHIGCGPNKNLSRVILALKNIDCDLHIIGKLSNIDLNSLKINKIQFQHYEHLNENELLKQYRWADIVSFPSTYEGFGMPIIEGQAMGCVILTSNIAPMTEVGDESVLYVNPYDVNSISNGFKRLIEDIDFRNELLKRGTENLKRFFPSEISSQYVKIYEELIN